ncbi:PulJ/GspJ family protein [Aquariibacter albus]|uniref:Prepilin-type N-terminal cleavage/methylation domain-containing protein n=1 Tax=Aquariibacter albus TaxID=2759899 RepID=A0A839HSU8_9BURK|nr:prepilin-type N-terminal cleavage/methylation domain-containing protein [Aquariibacter albus]MBB1162590.1 prepilin-type N-terminal cleavage/methylation domain-containing protein [Aquariibacter albus]
MQPARPAQAGFTLVELLVSLFIFAVLAGLGWQGIDGLVRSREASARELGTVLRRQNAIAQWEADLAALHETRALPALSFDGATLRLSRSTAEGVQIVAWSLRGGRWLRWAGVPQQRLAALQAQWSEAGAALDRDSPARLVMLDGLRAWQLYYWRDTAWTNAQSTGDADTQGQEQLPGGVRLLLSLDPPAGPAGEALLLQRDLQLALGRRS